MNSNNLDEKLMLKQSKKGIGRLSKQSLSSIIMKSIGMQKV